MGCTIEKMDNNLSGGARAISKKRRTGGLGLF
jgi:hypothetical protein